MILGTLIKTTASFWLLIGFFSGSNYEIDPLEQSFFSIFPLLCRCGNHARKLLPWRVLRDCGGMSLNPETKSISDFFWTGIHPE